jgi:signal transduction histidine kinase
MVLAINRGTHLLQQLLENLLMLSRATDGRLAMDCAPLQLREVLTEIEPVLRSVLGARKQRLQVVERRPLPAVVADRHHIGRVVINLLANAAKFGNIRTTIQVLLTSRDGHIRVVVQNRGPGISDGTLPYLFEPYYQVPSPEANQGVGLGLAIARMIVTAHGGRIGADNWQDRGARVWFELPLAAEAVRPDATCRGAGAFGTS